MSRAVSKKQKNFDINSKPLSEVIWEGTLCLENTWRMDRHVKSTDVMVLWVGIKIACLISQLTITKIVSNLENNRSFLMKSIEMEFHSHSGIGSCLKDSQGLSHCDLDCIQVTQDLQNCCILAQRLGQEYPQQTNYSILF